MNFLQLSLEDLNFIRTSYDIKYLPLYARHDKEICIEVMGFDDVKYVIQDPFLNITTKYFSDLLDSYIVQYYQDYNFHCPEIVYKHNNDHKNGCIALIIKMLSLTEEEKEERKRLKNDHIRT